MFQILLKIFGPPLKYLVPPISIHLDRFNIEQSKRSLAHGLHHWLPSSDSSVYNGLYCSARTCLKAKSHPSSTLSSKLNFTDCQIQSGGCECRLLTIANATALVLGDNPNKLFFDQAKIRQHLYQCLHGKGMLATFPL